MTELLAALIAAAVAGAAAFAAAQRKAGQPGAQGGTGSAEADRILASARAEAEAIAALRDHASFATGPMVEMRAGFVEISQRILEGRAAMLSGDADAAVTAFARAAEIQGMGEEGGDPPIIWYPIRRSLAAALLAKGDAAAARAKVLELLEDWPSDPYSYFVLAQAEAALGNEAAADDARRLSRVEWVGGEMTLNLA